MTALNDLVRPDRYPRSSRYDPAWLVGLDMGPNPLWLLEDLVRDLDLRPGMRVLDLGSGKGATSVFLAREFGVDVVAADWWIPAEDAAAVFAEAGVGDRVAAVRAEAHALPFEAESFDAIVSIDAFEYFGTADGRKILARTAHTESNGSVRVTPWFDLAAVDHSAVDHNVFPSHTSQNLLRRAWTSYVETHGGSDTTRSERAVMLQQYLRNIAADRVATHSDGGTFDFIQLRVVTLPVAAPGAAGNRLPAPTEDRLLPWWKVTPHGK
ncbi:DUF5819 family protein [Streptomyces sp. NPDC085929]|uniref:DUF5819 family protein n=1 Tax=Streptomyces sp. NPDC085929 TaxID=3365739 RepID=UPI0037D49A77